MKLLLNILFISIVTLSLSNCTIKWKKASETQLNNDQGLTSRVNKLMGRTNEQKSIEGIKVEKPLVEKSSKGLFSKIRELVSSAKEQPKATEILGDDTELGQKAQNVPLSAFHFFQKGNEAYEDKDYQNAIFLYKKAILLDRSTVEFYYNLGVSFYQIGKYAEAVASFEEGLRKNPQMPELYYNLALTYNKLYNTTAANEYYHKYQQYIATNQAPKAAEAPVAAPPIPTAAAGKAKSAKTAPSVTDKLIGIGKNKPLAANDGELLNKPSAKMPGIAPDMPANTMARPTAKSAAMPEAMPSSASQQMIREKTNTMHVNGNKHNAKALNEPIPRF